MGARTYSQPNLTATSPSSSTVTIHRKNPGSMVSSDFRAPKSVRITLSFISTLSHQTLSSLTPPFFKMTIRRQQAWRSEMFQVRRGPLSPRGPME